MSKSFFIYFFPLVDGKTQGLLTFMPVFFVNTRRALFGKHLFLEIALLSKCVFLMKLISAYQADINTKDMEDCFGVQMEMVWCWGIMNT